MSVDIQPILNGEIRAAARLMRDLDDRRPGALESLKALFPHTGKAYVIGVTGNPGAGKSTVVDSLIAHYRSKGERVGTAIVEVAHQTCSCSDVTVQDRLDVGHGVLRASSVAP